MAVPRVEPRLDTRCGIGRISRPVFALKLDCTTLMRGVGIPPSPNPMEESGANAHALGEPLTVSSTAMPAMR